MRPAFWLLVLTVVACGSRTGLDGLLGAEVAPPAPGAAPPATATPAPTAMPTSVPTSKPMPSCTDACAKGTSQCEADGVSTCSVGPNGCAQWGAATPCTANEACQQSGASASCACMAGYDLDGGACVLGPIAAPRPIAPLSTATVTSQTPRFHWQPAIAQSQTQVDICRDRACAMIVTSFRAAGQSGAPASALRAGVYFWRLHGVVGGIVGTQTSPVWEVFVGARSAAVDTSWGTTLDFNGDGFADVVLAGPSIEVGANLYLGGAGGLSTTPIAPTNPTQTSQSGTSVASAGDVNGDGFADVVVGTTGGPVSLYLGGAGAPTAPSSLVAPEGDINFGISVASAGDVNGDGYADVVVSAPDTSNSGKSAVHVYLGGPAGLSQPPLTFARPDYLFGYTAVGAGDVNGDGFADFVAAANRGLYLYLGSAAGLSSGTLITNDAINPVACVGDVNGDGFADIAYGSPGDYTEAPVNVLLGGATGLSTAPIAIPPPPGVGGFGGGNESQQIAGAGDVNGDGFADIVISAVDAGYSPQQAFVYLGQAGGPSMTPIPLQFGSRGPYAVPVAGAGDVNGDGFADVLVSNSFEVFLFAGEADGIGTTSASYFEQPGYAVASAGGALGQRDEGDRRGG